ncbi:FAD/NAD(P)-binding oxidoreductase [Chlorobium sp. N1]|uniref:NAD(P)/FAD-dependent oxidoreductase n=1 Tax=Chlorobium sp. N1 TaxID=2491138 RepID=UPI00103FC68F|nr:FAD/NAD(P)-binding oxidoreductase [Chlorobium sp. N1]TCD48259.1 NAD(P)/FAD-dependent oxidoreductase [Chlorobium sp. N1]
MAKVVVLGAGVSGHTCASFLKKKLGKKHEVVVVTPNSYYQWIPSNIWVGVGQMSIDEVRFQLKKVYDRWGIVYKQAKALEIHPEGDAGTERGYVTIEYTDEEHAGTRENVEYDYLVNATGPKLNFEATEGLGPDKNSYSVCTYSHAAHAWEHLQENIKKMQAGEKQRFLIGTGHAMATCQGAAFEYILNIAHEISKRGLSKMAQITWISNEYEVGDFGMGGAFIKRGGYITPTKVFTESILAEYGINWIRRAGIYKVEEGKAYYETLDGEEHVQEFDFAMLIPSFSGVGMTAFDREGNDITGVLFAPNKFMKVDADYAQKPFEEWSADDWPSTYQNPTYDNIYAVGIAFAPPHPISKPMTSPNGRQIFPTPPRTGMPSGVMGKITALNIAERIHGATEHRHRASMSRMGAACIVSGGFGSFDGLGASMTVFPVVPDWDKYPEWGRDMKYSVGEAGLAGHWLKVLLHYLFFHKAKGYPFWWLIPE